MFVCAGDHWGFPTAKKKNEAIKNNKVLVISGNNSDERSLGSQRS